MPRHMDKGPQDIYICTPDGRPLLRRGMRLLSRTSHRGERGHQRGCQGSPGNKRSHQRGTCRSHRRERGDQRGSERDNGHRHCGSGALGGGEETRVGGHRGAEADRGDFPLLASRNPGFWDSHYGGSLNSTLVSGGPRFNQLIEYNPTNPTEVIGDLAKTWEVNKAGDEYIFHLNDALWSDGKSVTADDIVFSLDRITQPGPCGHAPASSSGGTSMAPPPSSTRRQ